MKRVKLKGSNNQKESLYSDPGHSLGSGFFSYLQDHLASRSVDILEPINHMMNRNGVGVREQVDYERLLQKQY